MVNFYKYYLGHEFYQYDNWNGYHYICKICKVLIFFNHHGCYLKISKSGTVDLLDSKILSCEEMQIKKLLE